MPSANPFLGKYWILPSPADGQEEEVAIGWHGRDFPVVIASHDWITFAVSTDEWRRFPTLERYLLDNQIDPATIDTVASKGMVISLTADSPYWPAVDLFFAFGDDQHMVGAREVQALPDEQWVRDLLQATFGRVASDPFERQMHRAAVRDKYAAIVGVGSLPATDSIDGEQRVAGWLRFVETLKNGVAPAPIEQPEKTDKSANSSKKTEKVSRPRSLDVQAQISEMHKALKAERRKPESKQRTMKSIALTLCQDDEAKAEKMLAYYRRYKHIFE